MYYACVNSVVYGGLLMYGALMPVRLLVSFDFMALVSASGVAFLIWLHSRAYRSGGDIMDRYLMNAWLIFSVVPVAYVSYMWLDIGTALWRRGIWFTENDVLHSGMIAWVYYIHTRLKGSVKDRVA
jgi:hypothetical protein